MIDRKTIVVLLTFVLAEAHAAPPPDAQGNYVLAYTDARGQRQTYTYVPANKVAPMVTNALISGPAIQYEYALSNGATAQQPIEGFEFVSPAPWVVSNMSPPYGTAPNGFSVTGDTGSQQFGFRWRSKVVNGIEMVTIRPGQTLGEFKVLLPYLAGIVNAKVYGYVPPNDPANVADNLDENGNEVESPDLDEQLLDLMDKDGASALIAGPMIPLSSDFGAMVVGIKNELARWPTMAQASPTFVGQASQRLDVLADALTRRNASAANAAAADLENLIAATSAADLSPLGAYVLRFDLQETLRRYGTNGGRPPPPIR